LHAFGLNLRDPAQGTPHRNAELVPPHVGIPGRQQFFRQAFALAAKRTITVEHNRGRFVVPDNTPDFSDV
jgi:hypothetical protein